MKSDTPEPIAQKNIVVIGGGTGIFAVLQGLRAYPVHLTAICTVFDSGGSTGSLRDEYGWLPQGDLRRALVALDGDANDTLRELFTHRLKGGTLDGHVLGNLFMLGAEQLWGAVPGLARMTELFDIKGKVLPISINHSDLVATLSDGTDLRGETMIDTRSLDDDRTITAVRLEPSAYLCREAADAIAPPDYIVIGPGDLYTSLIPNLLVQGVSEAINSSKARLIYVSNLMTKYSETRDYTAHDFIETLVRYGIVRDKFHAVLVNTGTIPERLISKYRNEEKSIPVRCDDEVQKCFGIEKSKVLLGDFLNEASLSHDLIRHSAEKIAYAIVTLGGA